MQKLIEAIRQAGTEYCPPLSLELEGKTLPFGNAGAYIKCEEDLFLVEAASAVLVYDVQAGKTVQGEASADLDGWCAEMHFAQGKTFPCGFGEGKLWYEDEAIPAPVYKLRERLYLVQAGVLTLVIDTARFLFYGSLDGRFLGGNIVNMELN